MIAENIAEVRDRVRSVCDRLGRDVDSVQLVAVSKTFGHEVVEEALNSGIKDFGENYVQELEAKRHQLSGRPVRWHFIGHLQSNKVKYIAPYVELVHSVDNLRLAQEIEKRASNIGKVQDVLIEVHTTDEATKYGADPADVVGLAKEISQLDHIRLRGLMTMGPFSEDPNDSRPSFRMVMDLKGRIEKEGLDRVRMDLLSMGMTHDYEVAIEEGSTMIRIGTAIFGGRTTSNAS
jgi:PLP dependent protein